MIFEQVFENSGVRVLFQTPRDGSYFFGYYDQSPLSADGALLLAHHTDFDGRDVSDGDACDIGYFTLEDGAYHRVDTVTTFNWQQGARLQWLGASDRIILYNKEVDGRFVAVRRNLASGETRVYGVAVYSVHPSGTFALTIDFAHLRYCRYGYGYCGGDYPNAGEPIPAGDGVYRLDLATGEVTPFLLTEQLLSLRASTFPQGTSHWIEHMTWNRSGTRVALYFRYGDPHVTGMRTQLFTCGLDGSELYEFKENMDYSHMGWADDEEFIVYSRPGSRLRESYSAVQSGLQKRTLNAVAIRLLAPVYRFWKKRLATERQRQMVSEGNAGYYIFIDRRAGAKGLLVGVLKTDGHPSYLPDQPDVILTDTYADQDGFRHLLLVNKRTKSILRLGKFYSNNYVDDHRCDLHPRWADGGKVIAVDAPHSEGGRQIVLLDAREAVGRILKERAQLPPRL